MEDFLTRITRKLSLDQDSVERGERYGKRHSMSLSQVVNDLLSRLPLEEEETELTPAVRRLLGVASGQTDHADYRKYLHDKYCH